MRDRAQHSEAATYETPESIVSDAEEARERRIQEEENLIVSNPCITSQVDFTGGSGMYIWGEEERAFIIPQDNDDLCDIIVGTKGRLSEVVEFDFLGHIPERIRKLWD